MKNNRTILMVILNIVLVILLAACKNTSSESSAALDKQSQSNNSSQNLNDDTSIEDSTENVSNTNNGNTDIIDTNNNHPNDNEATSNDPAAAEEDLSPNPATNLKEKYLKKLNDTNDEVEEIRNKFSDDISTYAMKKVEGDRYDLWDELLNEVYGVLKEQLSTEEMDQLRNKQRDWIQHRDDSAKEASLKYKGGTMEQLEYVTVLANFTEERCYELIDVYMK